VVPSNAEVVFCHNDVLAANILKLNNGGIQLIDFEYGGINFRGFDIANHFNEYAGGTDTGIPNYDWAPTPQQQEDFVKEYVKASSSDLEVEEMLEQVRAFVMVNHLYWGLWAVNQASTEGCKDFDYLLYASNRMNQYFKCKEAHMATHHQSS
jgi:thiamine kinase-like enzyme